MNARTRWVNTLLFQPTDKVPLEPGHGRESTLARWRKEGLPDHMNADQANAYAYQQAGGKNSLPERGPGIAVNERMIPQFEEKIIEKKERSQIVQDWKGNICEIGNEFELRHLRAGYDFVTRRWIKCPVESHADWHDMQKRYDPQDASRWPENFPSLAEKLSQRDYPIEVQFSGPFWQLREWLGFENLCMMLHDDPALVQEMVEFWMEYILTLLRRTLAHFQPDSIHISEDMAYKNHAMISPSHCRELLLPCWRKWGDAIHAAGVPIYAMDSDGYIGELIPLWIEAGINCCDPIEVAAGNDINHFRQRFGKNMAYRGGVDKRCIAAGGDSIKHEIRRLQPVIDDGGFIPGCDHGVPHDISWDNYVYYVKLLAHATGWLD